MERNLYEVDEKLKMEFTPQQFTECLNTFKSMDQNKDGVLNKSEILSAMHNMGYRTMNEEDVTKMMSEVDINNDELIEFSEYLLMMKSFIKSGKETVFTKIVTKSGQNAFKIGSENSSSYTIVSEEEKSAYVRVINQVLQQDEYCKKILPIDPDTMDIFKVFKSGILLCKLVNKANPGTIDERVINMKDNMNVFNMMENLKLGMNAARSIGCVLVNMNPNDIIEENPLYILGFLWQLVKLIILGELNLKHHPQLIRLLNEGESISDLIKANPEDLLLRWFNFHLTNAGYDKKITNLNSDVKDSEKYLILLNHLNKELCDKSGLNETDLTKRAQNVLENAKKLGVDTFISTNDIVKGNNKLNVLFTAAIFNTCHGLDPPTEEEYEAAKLLEDDIEGSREERAFRMWINSLALPEVYTNNLYEDSKSGVILLKVLDKVKPGCVNWKNVEEKSTNKFKKLVNCGEAVEASKRAGLSIIGIGGSDVHDGNKKLILAIVWQLMRAHTLQVIGGKTEQDLLKWSNELINKETPLTSFKDKSLKNSLFFINLMNAIEPRAINWDIVIQDDDSVEALENNAKYAISVARKLGGTIFLVWEDIKNVNSKMTMTFVAALFDVYEQILKQRAEKKQID